MNPARDWGRDVEWDRLLVCAVSQAERVIETSDEGTWGLGCLHYDQGSQ